MGETVFVVGAYVSSDDPLLQVRGFIPLPAGYPSLGEAVAAAERDYRESHPPAADLRFLVYRAESGNAIVEVSRGEPFQTAGFYKVARVEVEPTGANPE